MTIPCITSFDMNAQLLAWLQGKTGGKEKGVKEFVWIGHKTEEGSDDGKWVPPGCEKMQQNQFKQDFICRNGCAFEGDNKKPICMGSNWEDCDGNPFDEAVGCAVLVNAKTAAGAASLNVPSGPISPTTSSTATGSSRRTASPRKSRTSAKRRSTASARRRSLKSRRLRGDAPPPSSLTVHPARWGPS